MSNKPRKFCSSFPCRNLALHGSSYCAEHKPAPLAKIADAFYLSPRWRRFRDWYITKHPLCETCQAEGRTVPAVIVDHIQELQDGGALFDESNAMSLCRACHNRKTSEEKRKRGARVYKYEEKSSGMLAR